MCGSSDFRGDSRSMGLDYDGSMVGRRMMRGAWASAMLKVRTALPRGCAYRICTVKCKFIKRARGVELYVEVP